jgi:hypothetical protein
MSRKMRAGASPKSDKGPKRTRVSIPEPFQVISSATVIAGVAKANVPMLLLYGEWLNAVGFPIGSAAFLTTDKRGELALNRLGLGFPRRLYIRAAK